MRALAFLLFVHLVACITEPLTKPSCRVDYDAVKDSLHGVGTCAGTLSLTTWLAVQTSGQTIWQPVTTSSLRLEGTWKVEGSRAVRRVGVSNTGSEPVTLLGILWTTGEAGLDFNVDRMLHNGYQSWSYTAIEALPQTSPVWPAVGLAPTILHGGDNEDLAGERPGVSWWWTFVSNAHGQGLVVGASSANVFKTFVSAGARPRPFLQITQGLTGDAVVIAPGQSVELDGLFLAFGAVGAGLQSYADHVRAQTPASRWRSRSAPLGGWGSWNLYYDRATAALLREEMAWAADVLVPLGLVDFLLDDGYERYWGEWQADVSKFGADLEAFNREQAHRGLKPAVWLAPFYVDARSPIVQEHPTWFVRRSDGSLRIYNNFGPSYAALSVTVSEARDFVVQSLVRYADWGYHTLKLDFLFGGALEDASAGLTSMQQYQLWMQTIRQAVPSLHIIGCGAPLLPSVGWVDSMRTGPDIAFFVSPEPQYPFIAGQARHTALRAFTSAWWHLDPDVLLLRGHGIDDTEAWTAVVSTALAGGNYLLGDGRQAGATRLAMALDPEIVAMTRDGVPAWPLDLAMPLEDAVLPSPLADLAGKAKPPHLWLKQARGRHWLAVFGWASGFETTYPLPSEARELMPPKTPDDQVVRRPVAWHGSLHVARHAVRLFTW